MHRPRLLPMVCGIAGVVGLLWSWLFGIRVAALSTSLAVGYLCTLFAFLVIVGLSTAVFVLTIRHLVREYRPRQPSPWFLVKLFVVWAAAEWAVSMLVTMVWIGRDGSLDSMLPFGSLVPALAFTPFGFLARFVGFHGMSAAFVVLVSVVAFKRLRPYAWAVACLVVVVTGAAWALYRVPAGPGLDVQIIANHAGASEQVSTYSQLVIFPEYGLDGIENNGIWSYLQAPANRETFYLGSRRQENSNGAQNMFVFGSTKQGIIQERAKTRLIPGGEYVPYAAEVPLKALRQHHTLRQFEYMRAIRKGSSDIAPLRLSDEIWLGSGVCASIIAPKDYRGLTKDGATVLTNSASLGVFNSPLFTLQHQGLARFMAVANARSFVQSSSDGLGFVIDHNGRMRHKISPVANAQTTIHSNSRKTPYTYLGEWPAYIGLLMLLWYGVRLLVGRSRRHARDMDRRD